MSVFLQDRFCPGCGVPAAVTYRFCRSCGFEVLGEETDIDQVLFLPPPEIAMAEGKGCFTHIIEWGIVGAIICVLGAIAIPNVHSSRPQARVKACYANMRVMLGAVEMYNMDNSVLLSKITEDDVSATGILVSKQYLKSAISHPETGCSYSSSGDLTATGKIRCALHGFVED
ncbi:MAG: hypothetical protein WA705_11495 [Candidatus Ozemobacteraceae bacterium]